MRKSIDIRPDYAEAHNNLGIVLHKLGQLDEAADQIRKALALKPGHVKAHNNLGIVLQELGQLDEAEKSFLHALELNPDFSEALGSYGILLTALGRWNEALECFDRKLELLRGEKPVDPNLVSFWFITKDKMKHDIEQLRYLEGLGLDADQFGELARAYAVVDEEIDWLNEDEATVLLTDQQLAPIKHSYNRPFHLVKAPQVPGSVLNRDLDPKSITRHYMENDPGATYFDDFLNPRTLRALRRFLLEGTIWYDFTYARGYIGAILADGFACPLLFQIAEELRRAFPGIFENHRLHQAWAYKYDSRQTGIRVHADFAAVNVNFWITPDSANLNPSNGGLIVYKEKAPLDWSFNLYNSDTEEGSSRIQKFLAEHDSKKMVVPYAENRAVLFNSGLFHETDVFEFKPGYENHRINVTMLFGHRQK